MRGAKTTAELDDRAVNVGPEFGDRARNLPAAGTVPAEQHREAGDEVADFRNLEVGTGARAECRDALGLERGEVRPTVILTHAVQEQGNLAVVRDDFAALEELDEIREAGSLVSLVLTPDGDDRRVVGMRRGPIGFDRLVVSEPGAVR